MRAKPFKITVLSLIGLFVPAVCADELSLPRGLSSKEGFITSRSGDSELCQIAGLNVAIWQPRNSTKPAPLVFFSHGYAGMNVQSVSLMNALRDAGYLVVSPSHNDAMFNANFSRPQQPFSRPSEWTENTHKDRCEDFHKLVKALKKDSRWNKAIDWTKIALIGHSLGGYTMLGLAGAWPSWKMEGVKGVVALSPYVQPLNQKGSLSRISIPIMYQTGSADFGVRPFLLGTNGTFARTNSPAYFVEIAGANHFTWTNLNRQEQKEELIEHYCISFLNKYVKGDRSAHPEKQLQGISSLMVK